MRNCIFCKIVSGEAESSIIYEDRHVMAFLDIHPVNPGHTLVISKKHAKNIYDIPGVTLSQITKISQDLALKIKKMLKAQGISMFQMNERAGDQDIMHYHLHIIPRYENDWFHEKIMVEAIRLQQATSPAREELDSIARKLK